MRPPLRSPLRPIVIAAALMLPFAAAAQNSPSWTKAGPAPQAAPQAAPGANANGGKVVESMDAGGYTYLRIAAANGETWVAVPQTQVPVGATVQWAPGAVMENFHSKSLNRTFPRITFSGGAQVVR